MPIRWSTVKVSEEVDEIEELMNSIRPTLWWIREKAEELRRIPNLPAYIDQPTVAMTSKVDNFNGYLKGYIERVRNLIYLKRHWRRNARLWSMVASNH